MIYGYFTWDYPLVRSGQPEVIRTIQEMARLFTEDFLRSFKARVIDLKSGGVIFTGSE